MRNVWIILLAGILPAAPLAWAAPKAKAPAEDTRSVAELLKALESPVPFVQAKAAATLATKGKTVLPKLTAALENKNVHARRGATLALAALGADARDARAKLVKALKDPEVWVRAGAAAALAKTGPLPSEQAKALVAAAGDPDPWVREVTMSTISAGVTDKALLLKAACDAISIPYSSWGICRHSMNIIKGNYKLDEKMASAALLKLLANPPQGMWDAGPAVVDLLVKMGKTKEAVAVLTKVLAIPDPSTAGRAADRLAQIGAPAKSALPALRKLTDPKVQDRARVPAINAIAKLESKQDTDEKK